MEAQINMTISQQEISVWILAGGKSSRMKQDKGLAKIKGKAMIRWTIDNALALTKNVNIISNNLEYKQFGLPCYRDIIPNKGPLGGIYTALYYSKTKKNLLLSCDTPFIHHEVLQKLYSQLGEAYILAAERQKGLEPLCAFYDKNLLSALENRLNNNELKLMNLLEEWNAQTVFFEEPHFVHSFVNINTPEDLNEMNKIEENKIKITLFGMIADELETTEIQLDYKEVDSSNLKAVLEEIYPQLQSLTYQISVNQTIVTESLVLTANDNIALLPPFSGG